jgi:hypothetical protein
MNKKLALFGSLFLIGMVMADFVTTPIYFTIPSTNSFTVFTISSNTASGSSAPYPQSENYYFNSSTGYSQLVNVCISGGAACQNASQAPAFRYRNTGTTNISIFLEYNATLPTGVLSCVNSTKPTGCGGTTIPSCSMGNLNSSLWATIATQIGVDSPCYERNATIYANFSGATAGTTAIGLTHNATNP